MKIILDECLPKRLTSVFQEEECWTVPQIGLSGYSDTMLLEELDKKSIDIFVTIDSNMEFQQKLSKRSFGTVVIRSVSNRYKDLLVFERGLKSVVKVLKSGMIVHIPK